MAKIALSAEALRAILKLLAAVCGQQLFLRGDRIFRVPVELTTRDRFSVKHVTTNGGIVF